MICIAQTWLHLSMGTSHGSQQKGGSVRSGIPCEQPLCLLALLALRNSILKSFAKSSLHSQLQLAGISWPVWEQLGTECLPRLQVGVCAFRSVGAPGCPLRIPAHECSSAVVMKSIEAATFPFCLKALPFCLELLRWWAAWHAR